MPATHLVFDIAQSPPLVSIGFLLGVTAMLVVGLVSVFRPSALPSWFTRRHSQTHNLVWVGAVGLAVAIAAGGYLASWWRLAAEANSPAASTLSGCVDRFHPSSGLRGDDAETAVIAGASFSYSDDELTPVFHQTVRNGGPLRPDAWVRITHVGNQITRLEVAEHGCPNSHPGSSGS